MRGMGLRLLFVAPLLMTFMLLQSARMLMNERRLGQHFKREISSKEEELRTLKLELIQQESALKEAKSLVAQVEIPVADKVIAEIPKGGRRPPEDEDQQEPEVGDEDKAVDAEADNETEHAVDTFVVGPDGKPRAGQGFLFVVGFAGASAAQEAQYVSALTRAIQTMKEESPKSKASIVTDSTSKLTTELADMFEFVIPAKEPMVAPGWKDKIMALLLTPYKETIYLDGDAIICYPLFPIFHQLKFHHFVMVLDPGRYDLHLNPGLLTPETLPADPYLKWRHPNTGFVMYRDSRDVVKLLLQWHTKYKAKLQSVDKIVSSESRPLPDDGVVLFPLLERQMATKYYFITSEYHMRVDASTLPHWLNFPVYIIRGDATCQQVNSPTTTARLFEYRKNSTVMWWSSASTMDGQPLSHCRCDVPLVMHDVLVHKPVGKETGATSGAE